jgi:hypothetical protein
MSVEVAVFLQVGELEYEVGRAEADTREALVAATAEVLRRIADEVESGEQEIELG